MRGEHGGEVSTSLAFKMSMPGFSFLTFAMRSALRALRNLNVGGIMDSYLVRIYRREEDNPRLLVGVVEEPGVNEKKAFHNLYELWDILNPIKKNPGQSRRNGREKRNSKNAPNL